MDPRFAELYEKEHDRVFRVTFALCRNRSLAEDATQEAFARALERWGRLRNRPWVAGWVTTTALNVARRMLRRRPHNIGIAATDPSPHPVSDIWQAVGKLPPRQREAVVLHYVVDLPLAEIAAAMGCREGTVKAHLAQARDTLRTQLEGAGDER